MHETKAESCGLTMRDCGIVRGFYSSGLAGTGRPRRGTDLAKAAYDLGRADGRLRASTREGEELIAAVVAEVECY